MHPIEKAVAEYITTAFVQKSVPIKPNEFRMSTVGTCHRALVYDYKYPIDETETNMRASFGSMWGILLVDILNRAGYRTTMCEHEVSLVIPRKGNKEPIKIVGHIDTVVTDKDGNNPVILDFKTLDDYAYRLNQASISRTYLWQQTCYMEAIRREYGVEVPAYLFMVNFKGDLCMKEVKYSKEVFMDIVKHVKSIADARETNREGVREYTKGKYPCTFCRHAKTCWGLPDNITQTGDRVVSYLEDAGIGKLIKYRRKIKKATDYLGSLKSKMQAEAVDLMKRLSCNSIVVPGIFAVKVSGDRVYFREEI